MPLTVATVATPVLEFWDSSTNTGNLGGNTCGSSPCQVITWGNPITLRGTGYFASWNVVISVPTSTGTQTFNVTSDATGSFTTTIAPTGYGISTENVTAEQFNNASYAASVLVEFENPPK